MTGEFNASLAWAGGLEAEWWGIEDFFTFVYSASSASGAVEGRRSQDEQSRQGDVFGCDLVGWS